MRKPPDKSILDKEIVWAEVIPELEKAIALSPEAAAALDRLEQLGCDRYKVLKQLYLYGGGDPADVLAMKTFARDVRKATSALANRLKDDAGDLEALHANLSEVGLTIHCALNEEMKAHGEFLDRLVSTVLRDLASDRITGRDHHLVKLDQMIRNAKKNVDSTPHHRELAELVTLVELKYESDYRRRPSGEKSAESIRKLIDAQKPR